jgi:hypothetical protein
MRDRLFSDDACADFCESVREEQNGLRMEDHERTGGDEESREIRRVIDAIKAGVPGEELKAEMEACNAEGGTAREQREAAVRAAHALRRS